MNDTRGEASQGIYTRGYKGRNKQPALDVREAGSSCLLERLEVIAADDEHRPISSRGGRLREETLERRRWALQNAPERRVGSRVKGPDAHRALRLTTSRRGNLSEARVGEASPKGETSAVRSIGALRLTISRRSQRERSEASPKGETRRCGELDGSRPQRRGAKHRSREADVLTAKPT